MSGFVASEMRFVGSLIPTRDDTVNANITFNGAGQQVVIPQNTAWTVVFFQAHSHTAGAGAAAAILTDLSSGAIYARIEITGQGSFAIENQGREISPLIKPSNGSETLTCQIIKAAVATEDYSVGANLEQAFINPAA